MELSLGNYTWWNTGPTAYKKDFNNPVWVIGTPFVLPPTRKKELIGVDLDGVLYSFIEAIHKKIPSIPIDPSTFDVTLALTLEEQELFKEYINDPSFWMSVPLYGGAMDFIDWLKSNSYQPIVITSRHTSVRNATITRVTTMLRIPQEDIIFEKNKVSALLGLGIGVHIEDDPGNLEQLMAVMDLFVPVRPWNKDWLGSYRKVSTVDRIKMYNNFEELKLLLMDRREKSGQSKKGRPGEIEV